MSERRAFVTNAEYYGHSSVTGATLDCWEAFSEWCRRGGISDPKIVERQALVRFMVAPAMRVLQYKEGHLFKVVNAVGDNAKYNGCFATIDRFHQNSLSTDVELWNYNRQEGTSLHNEFLAAVVLPDGSVEFRWLLTGNIGKADVPQQILDLAKAMLAKGCPLKTPGCGQ